MSTANVEAIIARAAGEPEFRQLLLHQPVAALAGYELTEGEINVLSSLIHEQFDAHTARLDTRLSRSTPSVGGALSDLSGAAGNTHSTIENTIF